MDSAARTEPQVRRRANRVAGSRCARSVLHDAAARRNAAGGSYERRRRWRPARDALWRIIDPHVAPGARIAILGAGNGDDVPLRRIARRAAHIDLIDLDAAALQRARRRVWLTRPVHTVVSDVTAGAAAAVIDGLTSVALPAPTPLSSQPYDLVIADLIATQLLFPALADSGRTSAEIDEILRQHGQALTDAVIARLHASAPVVIHVHDLLLWTARQPQPFTLDTALQLAQTDPAAALTLAHRGNLPVGCDPLKASHTAGAQLSLPSFWRWPFAPGTDYLVAATVTRTRRSLQPQH